MEKSFTETGCDRRRGMAVGQAVVIRIKRHEYNGIWEREDHRLGKKSMLHFHTAQNRERGHGILVISHRQKRLPGVPVWLRG